MNNTTNNLELDREAWLTEAAQLIQDEVIQPALPAGHTIPHPFRVSVGYPPRSRGAGKVIAFCCTSNASADNHNEIFITPEMDDSAEILAALVHEMVHQADDCKSGHRNFFASVARKVGLVGKLTATTAGDNLLAYFNQSIISVLGNIPHAKLSRNDARKKQGTRMLKIECDSCGFHFRASQTQIERIAVTDCIACQTGTLQLDV